MGTHNAQTSSMNKLDPAYSEFGYIEYLAITIKLLCIKKHWLQC